MGLGKLWLALSGAVVGYTYITAAGPPAADGIREELKTVRSAPGPASPQRLTHESRLLFYLAESLGDTPQSEEIYREGRDKAQEARAKEPKNPAALLWWAANTGGVARMKKNLWALGALKEIEATLLELKDVDAGFGYGAASRVLGKIYLEAPRFFSIGSSSRSHEHFQLALKIAPTFPGNEIGFAEWLVEEGEKEKASTLVKQIKQRGLIDNGDYGDFRWERDGWKLRLEDLTKKLGGQLP